jgi:hypothetical protein
MPAFTEKTGNGSAGESRRSLGLFVTQIVEHLPEGGLRISHSRWHRKGLPPIELSSKAGALPAKPVVNPWLQLWAPQRLAWWIAVLFVIGSACFAVASFAANWPQYCPAVLVHSGIINAVFFAGSIFFTLAAWLQLEEAINGDVADILASHGIDRPGWRWFGWKPHNAGYSASLLLFAGTVLFNLNTGDALLPQLTWGQEEVLIWIPDVIGSLCFLASGYLALVEISQGAWSWQSRQLSWWIVMVNLLGCIAFMVSAGFGYFVPGSGQTEWPWGANFCTLLGALCFLVASYLMIPEQAGAGRSIDTLPGSGAEKAA